MTAKQLIDEAISLPVEERALVVDSLLRSLNQPDTEVDSQWATLAQRRLLELRNGSVQGVLLLPRSSVGAGPDAPASRGTAGHWSGQCLVPNQWDREANESNRQRKGNAHTVHAGRYASRPL